MTLVVVGIGLWLLVLGLLMTILRAASAGDASSQAICEELRRTARRAPAGAGDGTLLRPR